MKLDKEQQALAEQNTGLVIYIINKYKRSASLEIDDMISIGFFALCNAAAKYDPDKGYAFSTFATRSILNEISKELKFMSRKKRGQGCVTVSADKLIEDNSFSVYERMVGFEPDFQDAVINKIACEPIWKMVPTYSAMVRHNVNRKEYAKLLGVTASTITERKRKEFNIVRARLLANGIDSIV